MTAPAVVGTAGGAGTYDGSSSASLNIAGVGVSAGDYIILAIERTNSSNLAAPTATLNVTGSMGAAKVDRYQNDVNDTNFFVWLIRATGAE